MSFFVRGYPFGFFEGLKVDIGLCCAGPLFRSRLFYRGVVRDYLERKQTFYLVIPLTDVVFRLMPVDRFCVWQFPREHVIGVRQQ